MASISQDANGNRTIQFVAADKKRRSIRLGKQPDRFVVNFKHQIEMILAAQDAGRTLDQGSVDWYASLGDKLSKRVDATGIMKSCAHLGLHEALKQSDVAKVREIVEKLNRDIAIKMRAFGLLTDRPMPKVPPPLIVLNRQNHYVACPERPGVYFVYDALSIVVYVGKSACLRERVNLDHENINEGESVSWIERPLDELSLDECFYIWLLKPSRNRESQPATKSKKAGES